MFIYPHDGVGAVNNSFARAHGGFGSGHKKNARLSVADRLPTALASGNNAQSHKNSTAQSDS